MALQIRKNMLPAAIGLGAFIAGLIAFAPASILAHALAGGVPGFASSNAEGTVWRGGLSDVSANGVYYGDVSYKIAPLSLLTGFPRIDLQLAGGAVEGGGAVRAGSGRRFAVADFTATVDLAAYAQRGIMGEPVSGAARLFISRLEFTQDGCRRAEGEIWTDVLSRPAKRFNSDGFDMNGEIACDGADFIASLSGSGSDGAARLALRVRPDLSYEIDAEARPAEDQVATALRFFGFEDEDGALVYGSAGVLRGAGS